MKIENEFLQQVIKKLSPNCDDRPANTLIDLIVIHSISLPPGEYGGGYIEELFTNQLKATAHPYFATILPLKVSAHVLIGREGRLTQFVPFGKRAWHAGTSSFAGREACNDFSIGIELEGTDNSAYTEEQYHALVQVVHALMQQYPGIVSERITGHSDIAPGRKTDPGSGFDWHYFRELLHNL